MQIMNHYLLWAIVWTRLIIIWQSSADHLIMNNYQIIHYTLS